MKSKLNPDPAAVNVDLTRPADPTKASHDRLFYIEIGNVDVLLSPSFYQAVP